MARLETVRVAIALVAENKWPLYQLDVKSAFLKGALPEEIYVEQLQGFVIKREEYKLYKLIKAFYGLNPAPKAW